MNINSILEKVEILASRVCGNNLEDFHMASRIVDDLHIDSLMLVMLTLEIEKTFSISVHESVVAKWVTVSDVVYSVCGELNA